MARYYGDFRSIDTSTDPKGQKYRVVIFTGYTGGNPYEYDDIVVEDYQYHQPVGWYVPIKGTELTMTDRPFVVNYEGDTENIYKPYRCSTATVSFLQDNINLDFLNSNGTSTLVVLLKWKNEVEERFNNSNIPYMYNTQTGATLNRLTIWDNASHPYPWDLLYSDYEPYKYDNFCYTVEWVGYSTPETFSMDYSHTTDTFTLNAQDALSTLQFVKYKRDAEQNQLYTLNDELFFILKQLSTYKKIHVTDTLKFTNPYRELDGSGNPNDITTEISVQSLNNFDEDKRPQNELDVLTRLLTYLNLTAIPYKDTLIITTPNAIAGGWNYYHTYTLPNNNYILNWPNDGADYTYNATEYISSSYNITDNSFADGGTTISTNNVYNSVTANVDNYEVGDLMPELDNTDKFVAETNMSIDYYTDTETEGNETVTNYYTWERRNVIPPANGSITLKHYNADQYGGVWNNSELNYTPSVTAYDKPGCYLIEHSGVQQTETYATLPLNSNYGRDFYFHTARFISGQLWVSRRDAGYNNNPPSMDDKSVRWQPMLIFDSDNVLMFAGDNLNICGEWTFYCGKDYQTYIAPYSFDKKTAKSQAHTGQLSTLYNYVWGKVRVGDKWLSNTGETYYWVPNETWVRIYIDWKEGKLAFSTPYEFKQTNRNIKGTCIPLPITGDEVMFGNVHIELDRPLGTYYFACSSAILKDFEVKVITVDGTHNRNIEFKTEINADNVTEFNVDSSIGSQHTNGALWSEAVKGNGTYKAMRETYNVATGNHHLPEQHITANVANQYATPTIGLQMTLHNDLTPYSLITWSKLDGKKFIVNSTEIDYEYNRQNVSITEVKTTTPLTTVRRNTTRNYRRNGDIIANPQTTYNNRVTLNNEYPIDWSNFGGFGPLNGNLTLGTYNDVWTAAANVTIQPNFTNGEMQVSVPNEIENNIAFGVDDNGLNVTETH